MSINKLMDKEVIYTHTHIYKYIFISHIYIYKEEVMYIYIYITHTVKHYSVIKKNEILPTCMDLESIMLNGISQPEKDKYCRISLLVESKNTIQLVNLTKKE